MDIRNVRHVVSQELDIRVDELRILRLSLNRHLPERLWVERHTHQHSQFLLYLSGNGRQLVGVEEHETRAGMLFYLPPDCEHSFTEGTGRRPLCLALDLECAGAMQPIRAVLVQAEVQMIRQALARLHEWHPGRETVRPGEAAAVLQIVEVLMRVTGLLPKTGAQNILPVVRRVREIFRDKFLGAGGVSEVAELVGYHRDHLTRLLRRETGMSTGQLRSVELLKKAQNLLAGTDAVAEVSEKCGFADPNYFSRWYRRQTGMSPRSWRAGKRGC